MTVSIASNRNAIFSPSDKRFRSWVDQALLNFSFSSAGAAVAVDGFLSRVMRRESLADCVYVGSFLDILWPHVHISILVNNRHLPMFCNIQMSLPGSEEVQFHLRLFDSRIEYYSIIFCCDSFSDRCDMIVICDCCSLMEDRLSSKSST